MTSPFIVHENTNSMRQVYKANTCYRSGSGFSQASSNTKSTTSLKFSEGGVMTNYTTADCTGSATQANDGACHQSARDDGMLHGKERRGAGPVLTPCPTRMHTIWKGCMANRASTPRCVGLLSCRLARLRKTLM